MSSIDLTTISYSLTATLSDGKRLYLDDVAETIAWEENEKELSVRLNLTLRDVKYKGVRLSKRLALCTVIYLYADWGGGMEEIFRGTIWEWQHSQINNDQIILTCYDMLFYLQKSVDSKYYAKGKKTKAIITDILDSWKVEMGEYSGADVEHNKTLYKSKAISAMITETLDYAKKHGGKKSILRASKGKAEVITYGANEDVYMFEAGTNIVSSTDKFSMTDLVTRVIITGKDDKEGKPKIEATLNGKTEYGILQAVQSMGSDSLQEAKEAAQDILDEKGEPKRTLTLVTPDFPPIRKGEKIYVMLDKEKGYFVVKGVSHNATQMKMQMEVEPA